MGWKRREWMRASLEYKTIPSGSKSTTRLKVSIENEYLIEQ